MAICTIDHLQNFDLKVRKGKIAKREKKTPLLSQWYKTNMKLFQWYNISHNPKTNPLINQIKQNLKF